MRRFRTAIIITLSLVIFCVLAIFGFDPWIIQRIDTGFSISTGEAFISAIGENNETAAFSVLSADARQAVTANCEDGKVISCFDKLGRKNWGTLRKVFFEFGGSSGKAYSTVWDQGAILMVIKMIKENGQWRVSGWRGMIRDDGGWPDGLIDGSNHTNQFPPEATPNAPRHVSP